MNPARGRRASWILAGIILIVIAAMAIRSIDPARVLHELRGIRAGWVVAGLLCFGGILPLWAAQWTLLAPRTPRNTLSRMLGVTAMTSSTMNTTPFFVGEAAALVLLVARAGVTRAEAVSVLLMDQLLVGVAKIAVLSTAALTLTLPIWMREGWAALAAGVLALLAVCAALAWKRDRVVAIAARVLPPRVAGAIGSIGSGLDPLWIPTRGGVALMLALAKKMCEVLAIACLQRAFGVTLPFATCVLVLAALNLATLLPVVPGNLGVYEGAVVLVYTRLGLSTEHAVSIALVQHACYFAALALPGYGWAAVTAASRVRVAAS